MRAQTHLGCRNIEWGSFVVNVRSVGNLICMECDADTSTQRA
jgi:hypothetical protein